MRSASGVFGAGLAAGVSGSTAGCPAGRMEITKSACCATAALVINKSKQVISKRDIRNVSVKQDCFTHNSMPTGALQRACQGLGQRLESTLLGCRRRGASLAGTSWRALEKQGPNRDLDG